MKKLIIIIFTVILSSACRQDKGKNKTGAYKLEYNCIRGHYEESSIMTQVGTIFIPYTTTSFVCDEFIIDTIYNNNLKNTVK